MPATTATTNSIPTPAPEGIHYTVSGNTSTYSFSVVPHEPTPRD